MGITQHVVPEGSQSVHKCEQSKTFFLSHPVGDTTIATDVPRVPVCAIRGLDTGRSSWKNLLDLRIVETITGRMGEGTMYTIENLAKYVPI